VQWCQELQDTPTSSRPAAAVTMGAMCCRDDAEVRRRERQERSRTVRSKYGAVGGGGFGGSAAARFEDGFQESDMCTRCHSRFGTFNRRHHCRRCKRSFCSNHSSRTVALRLLLEEIGESGKAGMPSARVCDSCFTIVRRAHEDKNTGALSF
jgi:hypothetical protein